MPHPKGPRKGGDRSELIRAITTPLGFFVLALLIAEATLMLVLTCSKLESAYVWSGFLWMSGIFIGVVLIVAASTVWNPKNLLYGKEEHANPALDPSALRDAVAEIIAKNVKDEALKPQQRSHTVRP